MLEGVFGNHIRVFVARELTKIHETLYRGRIKDVHDMLEKERIEYSEKIGKEAVSFFISAGSTAA